MTKPESDRIIEIQQRLSAMADERKSTTAEVEAIQTRKEPSADDITKLKDINTKLDNLNVEDVKLRSELANLQVLPSTMKTIELSKGDKPMTFDEMRSSKAYENAWAKYCLQRKLTDEEDKIFKEVNARALATATTTTGTSYAAPTEGADGTNNGGIFIPGTISVEILTELKRKSPFFAGIKKISIVGSINFPYRKTGTGAKWYAEGTATEDASNEYAYLALGGFEIANFNKITWKLENQAIGSFISYITSSIIEECGEALITAVLYGTGSAGNSPTGVTVDALKVTSAGYSDVMAEMKAAPAKLRTGRKHATVNASYFVAPDILENITFAQDADGRYQFNALIAPTSFGGYKMEADENLNAGDFIFGNPQNYILNEQVPIGTQKTVDAKYRRNDYSAYGIYDGKAIPSTFVYGTKA